MHGLLTAWKGYRPEKGPYVLPGDEAVLCDPHLCSRFAGWQEYVASPDFGAPADAKLHLDLLPVPFLGNLSAASIFLLMLNPGFGPHDYFGEYLVPQYRSALLSNLRQDHETKFMFLDPQFSWHGGVGYWHTKLRSIINEFAHQRRIPYGEARLFFQSRIAALELAPYHSLNFAVPAKVLNSMESVKLVRAFVRDELVPRAKSGECLIVATRAVRHWGLLKHDPILAYTPAEARGAHLGPKSRGGSAILQFISHEYAQRVP